MQKKVNKKSILNTLQRSITIILAVVMASIIVTVFYSSLFMTPLYTSTATVCLSYEMVESMECNDPNEYVTENIDEYIFLICTDGVKEEAEEALSKTEQKYKNVNIDKTEIDAEQVDDTNIVYINVTSNDPKLSCDLCKVYAEIGVIKASKIGNIGATIIENPVVSEKPSSPNLIENSLIVSSIAIIVTVILLVIKSKIDQKIKNGKDVQEKLGILFLGDIPNVDKNTGKNFVQKIDSNRNGSKEK